MNIVVDTLATRDYLGEDEALRCIKEAGFDGVDYSFFTRDPALEMLGEDYRQQAQRTKELLQKHGLFCHQTHAPLDMQYTEAMDCSQPHYRDVVRALESAAIIGASYVVVHGVGVPKDCPDRARVMVEYNERFYQSLQPYCEKFGVRICVENLVTSAFYLPEMLDAIMEKLDPRWFTICLDIGHTHLQPIAPENFLRQIGKDRIAILHVHDNNGKDDQHILPYTGTINWEKTTQALSDVNFNGDMALEVFAFLRKFPAQMQLPALSICADTARYLAEQVTAKKSL